MPRWTSAGRSDQPIRCPVAGGAGTPHRDTEDAGQTENYGAAIHERVDHLYVLVGGWPGSGKTTLARALATRLGLAYLSKDDLKESLWQQFGAPTTVEESRRLGEAAVRRPAAAGPGLPGCSDRQHLVRLHPTAGGAAVRADRRSPLSGERRDRSGQVRGPAAMRRPPGRSADRGGAVGPARGGPGCRTVGRGRHRGTGGRRCDRLDRS